MPPRVWPPLESMRLAQGVPGRVSLGKVPAGIALRAGTTASILVMTGESDPDDTPKMPAALP